MRSISLFILLCLGSLLWLQGQTQQYIQFTTDVVLSGQQFYKGEVFAVSGSDKETKQFAFLLVDRLFTVPSDQAKVLTETPLDFSSKKSQIVSFDAVNKLITVDVGALASDKDTCRVVTSSGTVIPFIEKKKAAIPLKDFGERFRVCIPGALPLIYETRQVADATSGAEASAAPAEAADTPVSDAGSTFPLLPVIAIGLAAVASGIAIMAFLRAKNNSEELHGRIDRLQSEINGLRGDLSSRKEESFGKKGSPAGLATPEAEKVKSVDVQFALPWVRNAISFLQSCEQVFSQAEQLRKDQFGHPGAANLIAALIHPSYEATRSLPFSRWMQLLGEMQAKGVIADEEVVNAFSQLKNDGARQEELERLLLKQIGVPYASQALILAEAMCNLQHLKMDAEIAAKARSQFSELRDALESRGRNVGMKEYRTVSQRSPIAGQPQWLQLQGQSPMPPFSAPKGHIAQILRVGIVTQFEPNPLTIVLEGHD